MLITGLHLVPVCFLDFRNIGVSEGNKSWTVSCYPRQRFRRFLALVSMVVNKLNRSHRMRCSYIKTVLSCGFCVFLHPAGGFFPTRSNGSWRRTNLWFSLWAANGNRLHSVEQQLIKTDGFLIAASCLRMSWRLSGSVNTQDSTVCVKTRIQHEYVWLQTAALAVNGRWQPWGLRWGGCIV